MARQRNHGLVERLAIAWVSGVSTADWARENSVKLSTAYGWAASEAFKARVRVHREALAARTIDLLAEKLAQQLGRQIARRVARSGVADLFGGILDRPPEQPRGWDLSALVADAESRAASRVQLRSNTDNGTAAWTNRLTLTEDIAMLNRLVQHLADAVGPERALADAKARLADAEARLAAHDRSSPTQSHSGLR
jgi:hypothetical protein